MSWSRLPLIEVRSSSVNLPHFTFAWPLYCFHLPCIWSQFIPMPPRFLVSGNASERVGGWLAEIVKHGPTRPEIRSYPEAMWWNHVFSRGCCARHGGGSPYRYPLPAVPNEADSCAMRVRSESAEAVIRPGRTGGDMLGWAVVFLISLVGGLMRRT